MKYSISRFFVPLMVVTAFAMTACAQNENDSTRYNAYQTFDPAFDSHPGNLIRAGDGSPGSQYWQNRADYVIHASLDTVNFRVSGTDEIHYTNNSPQPLSYLWLQLEQNLYKKTSLGAKEVPASGEEYGPTDFTGGYDIKSVEIKEDGAWKPADYVITDTRMQIRLSKALIAKGGETDLRISYSFEIPQNGVDIMGRTDTKNGWIFEVAQWYPRMAVYDDVLGWNNLPFLGAGEFYLEYGNFDVYLTVPWNQIVVASGKLQNPRQVLTPTEIKRLRDAENSEKTIYIRKPDEVDSPQTRPVQHGTLTWHYKIENSRDFTWASSKAFVWDAAGVDLPGMEHNTTSAISPAYGGPEQNKATQYGGHKPLAMSVYPVESIGKDSWSRSTEYLKFSMEFYSKLWKFDYPWTDAVTVAGDVDGMEYPGIVFCGMKSKNAELFGVTTHEIGHTWFPMVVGSDERRYAWMDEGFNTFQNYYSKETFNHGEYAPAQTPVDEIMGRYVQKNEQPILTYADRMKKGNLGYLAYSKPAAGLFLLREVILGHDRFDYAFQTYVHRWAYKHPKPKDFFRTMDDASGSDLNWFWKGWFYHDWKLDQAVTNVSYENNDPKDGAVITLVNKDKLVMPVTLKIVMDGGKTDTVNLPFQIWEKTGTFEVPYDSHSRIDSVIVDPEHMLPDVDRSNNVWP
ncbi:MAG TPA: M1 family metallopeptidase [Balneolales bacterium]|nr:M1 family metallopeptidase [Balneolales bacterium]